MTNPLPEPLRHIPSVHNQPAGGQKPKRSSRTPIIVVPGALTSLITIYNAKDILEDMKFVSTEEKRAQKAQREPTILVNRKKEGNTGIKHSSTIEISTCGAQLSDLETFNVEILSPEIFSSEYIHSRG